MDLLKEQVGSDVYSLIEQFLTNKYYDGLYGINYLTENKYNYTITKISIPGHYDRYLPALFDYLVKNYYLQKEYHYMTIPTKYVITDWNKILRLRHECDCHKIPTDIEIKMLYHIEPPVEVSDRSLHIFYNCPQCSKRSTHRLHLNNITYGNNITYWIRYSIITHPDRPQLFQLISPTKITILSKIN